LAVLKKSAFFTILVLALVAALAGGSVGAVAASTGSSSPPSPRALAFDSPRSAPATLRTATTSTVSPIACDGAFDVVASPNGTGHNDVFATSVISANDVWAVGVQTNAASHDQTLAEHWNGTSWTIVPTPDPGPSHNDLNGVAAISTNDVWAIGEYWDPTIGAWLEFAAHWNGSAWSVTILNYGYFLAITALASNNVWVVGTTYYGPPQDTVIDHWDGSTWSQGTGANPSSYANQLFYVSAWSATDVWAVGIQVASVGSPDESLAEHWNGSSWTVVTTPNDAGGSNSINAVVALEGGHAVGVGDGGFVNGFTPAHGEAWDLLASGSATDAPLVAPGTGDNVLEGVAISGATVEAVGFWRSTGSSARQTLAWPGTWNASTHTLTWGSIAPSASPGSANNVLFAVAAVSPYAFWGVGYTNSGGFDRSLMESYCALRLGESAPASTFLGSSFSVTVTAKNPDGTTASGYRGTVHFTSTDTHAVLPSDYTFTAPDAGVHTFSGVVLNSQYLQTIIAADATTPFVSASVNVTVACPGACAGTGGTPGSRGSNPASSPGTPGSRTGEPSTGAGSPVPAGARFARFSSSRTQRQGAAMTAAGVNTAAPSNNQSVARPGSPGAAAYNVALPAVGAVRTTRARNTLQQPLGAVTSVDQAIGLGASGLLGLLALVLLSARRREERRRFDAGSRP
jgi:hypothetical protein